MVVNKSFTVMAMERPSNSIGNEIETPISRKQDSWERNHLNYVIMELLIVFW